MKPIGAQALQPCFFQSAVSPLLFREAKTSPGHLNRNQLGNTSSCFRYFRHASGALLILSKNLAQYVNVNRSPFVSGRGFHWYDIGGASAPNGKVICFPGVWDKGRFDAMELYFLRGLFK
ncbi:hypothetical protein RHMOL_Rhmol07G0194600 [Rhododendron molle]|uniref:Uncharacterized protein n=1 Tax=Rhododendron molle TaxID=49168 RepID=A0ACC0N2P2_RHOML|nr:hypothetical protein RHMOL_Rhmol07G0194600 [Rhododendron molle]